MGHRILPAMLGLLALCQCGVRTGLPVAPTALSAPLPQLPESPLDDDDEFDDLDQTPLPQLPEQAVDRLKRRHADLKQHGELGERRWHLREPLPHYAEMVKIDLHNDADKGISDGYAHFLLVPLGGSGEPLPCFYVSREGGFAGWVQWIGPFGWSG